MKWPAAKGITSIILMGLIGPPVILMAISYRDWWLTQKDVVMSGADIVKASAQPLSRNIDLSRAQSNPKLALQRWAAGQDQAEEILNVRFNCKIVRQSDGSQVVAAVGDLMPGPTIGIASPSATGLRCAKGMMVNLFTGIIMPYRMDKEAERKIFNVLFNNP